MLRSAYPRAASRLPNRKSILLIEMHSPIPWRSVPTLVHEELHATRQRRRNWQSDRVGANTPHNGMCFEIFVWHFLCKEFPENYTIRPHVDTFRTWFVSYNFWSHPSYRARKTHNGTNVIPFTTCTKVAYFYHEIISDQDAEKGVY